MPDAVAQPAPRSQPASQPQLASRPEIRPTGPAAGKRLAWLDALRGIAALCVVFDHLTYSALRPVRDSVYHWFDPGQYGVFVFFLVSGYIVPASLERKGSVRGFWVSRVFRLYPLYLFAVSAMIVLWASGIGSLSGMRSDPVTALFADVFMLQSVLWAPTVPNVVWSLAYEMVFYLMLTALFLGGLHRRSSRYSLVFAAAAVGIGGVLVPGILSHRLLTPGVVVAIADSLVAAGLVLALAGRGRTQWHDSPLAENYIAIRKAFNSLEFAGLTFAVAMLCRHRKVPRALAWLGLVSYSVYLLHPALIDAYTSMPWTRNENFVPMELLLVAVFVLVLLVCCGLTHRFIEAPMQRLGRRAAGWLDARFGPDVPAPRRPSPDPVVALASERYEARVPGVRAP